MAIITDCYVLLEHTMFTRGSCCHFALSTLLGTGCEQVISETNSKQKTAPTLEVPKSQQFSIFHPTQTVSHISILCCAV